MPSAGSLAKIGGQIGVFVRFKEVFRFTGALVLGSFLTGCVTVETRPVRPYLNQPIPSGETPMATGDTNPAPILRPRPIINAIGEVPYNGLSLPLISPSGTSVVTQSGQLSDWDAILARPSAQPPFDTRIEVWSLQSGHFARLDWTTPSADRAGLILGRSCTETHVIVERINPDGSRSVGRLNLRDGSVQWPEFNQRPLIRFGAIELRDGTVVCSARVSPEVPATLLIEKPGFPGRELAIDGRSLLWPVASPDQTLLAAIIDGEPAQIAIISLVEHEPVGSPRILRRIDLGGRLTDTGAYQAVAAVEATPELIEESRRSSMMLVHPQSGRVMVFDAAGLVNTYPFSSAAYAPMPYRGLLGAAAKSLVFQPEIQSTQHPYNNAAAKLFDGHFFAKALTSGETVSHILISPEQSTVTDQPMLTLYGLQLRAR